MVIEHLLRAPRLKKFEYLNSMLLVQSVTVSQLAYEFIENSGIGFIT